MEEVQINEDVMRNAVRDLFEASAGDKSILKPFFYSALDPRIHPLHLLMPHIERSYWLMADKPESLNVTHLHVPDQIAGQGEFIQPNVVDQYRDFLKEHQGLQLVGMLHNHPSNSSRSGTDIEQLGSLEGLLGEPMLGFVFCNTLLYQVELAKISLYETHLCSGDSDYSPTQSEMELWIKDKSSSKKFSCALGQILGVDLTDALHPREERKVPVVFDRRGRNLSPSNLRQILVPHYVERYMDNIDKNLEAFDSRGVAIPVQTVNDYKI